MTMLTLRSLQPQRGETLGGVKIGIFLQSTISNYLRHIMEHKPHPPRLSDLRYMEAFPLHPKIVMSLSDSRGESSLCRRDGQCEAL